MVVVQTSVLSSGLAGRKKSAREAALLGVLREKTARVGRRCSTVHTLFRPSTCRS